MRLGRTAKVLAECKLKYYRISECADVGACARTVLLSHLQDVWELAWLFLPEKQLETKRSQARVLLATKMSLGYLIVISVV